MREATACGELRELQCDFFYVHQQVTGGTVTPTHYDIQYWKLGEA